MKYEWAPRAKERDSHLVWSRAAFEIQKHIRILADGWRYREFHPTLLNGAHLHGNFTSTYFEWIQRDFIDFLQILNIKFHFFSILRNKNYTIDIKWNNWEKYKSKRDRAVFNVNNIIVIFILRYLLMFISFVICAFEKLCGGTRSC